MGGRREDAREERQEVSFRLLPGGELSDEEEQEEEEGDVTPRAVQLHSVREEKEPKEGRWVRELNKHLNYSDPELNRSYHAM